MATPIKIYWMKTRVSDWKEATISDASAKTKTVTTRSKTTKNNWAKVNSKTKAIKKRTWSKVKTNYDKMEYYQTSTIVWYTGINKRKVTVKTTNKKGKQVSKQVDEWYCTRHTIAGYSKKVKGWSSEFDLTNYQPASISITYQDLDVEDDNVGTDVGRDRTTAYIVRNRKRSNVRTLELEFPPMRASDLSPLLKKIVDPDNPTGNNGYIQLNFDDPLTNDRKTVTFYAGDRQVEALANGWWGNIKVTLVEA